MSHYFINDKTKKSDPYKFVTKVGTYTFTFATNSGVFAKRGLDFGSRILIEALLKENVSGKVLDLGCGYGPIGIVLSKHFDLSVDMSDVNKEALSLTRSNIKRNNVVGKTINSKAYEKITKKYNYIITNPPIRAGKKAVYEIIFGAKNNLTKDGELWIVIRKEQGAKSLIKDMQETYTTDVITRNKGFYVIKCKMCWHK